LHLKLNLELIKIKFKQKRIELVEENYEKTMNQFEQAKRALNNLDEQIQGGTLGGGNLFEFGRFLYIILIKLI
jgi:hypothetical protein